MEKSSYKEFGVDRIEKKFESFDGAILQKYIYTCENPKAIVQIAHGMQEYCATYFEFAKYLADNGYMVVMFDERGHGKTVEKQDLGKVNKEKHTSISLSTDFDFSKVKDDIFRQTVIDHIYLTSLLKNKYDLPLYFIGHSYGSFIGQAYIEECNAVDKVVLMGSCYMKKPLVAVGRCIAKIGKTFKGEDSKAKMIENISFNSYKKKFESGSWITTDKNETKKFYDDELNGGEFSYGFYNCMFKNQLLHPNKKAVAKIDKKLPMLILSGQDDVIGDMGKGVTKLYQFYKNAGLNVNFKLYPNKRHALLQEDIKLEVFEEILNFLQKK